MMKAYSLLSAVALLFICAGCGVHRTVVSEKTETASERQTVADYRYLSERLGIDVTSKDEQHLALYKEAAGWLGTPYRYGGTSQSGCDCSGMVMQIYKSVYQLNLERNSAMMKEKNCREIRRNQLNTGDLVFFATSGNRKRINHVGIYLKDNKFIHASSSRGVIVSDLDESYYQRTYVCSGQVNRR